VHPFAQWMLSRVSRHGISNQNLWKLLQIMQAFWGTILWQNTVKAVLIYMRKKDGNKKKHCG